MLLGCFHLCQGSLFLSEKAAVKFIIDELKGSAKIILISHVSKCPVILSFSFASQSLILFILFLVVCL